MPCELLERLLTADSFASVDRAAMLEVARQALAKFSTRDSSSEPSGP